MLLEEDARNYVQRFQKQEPQVHLSLLNQVVSGKYQRAIVLTGINSGHVLNV